MQEALFILSGFGFLLAWEKPAELGPYSGEGNPRPFLIEGVHLMGQVLALLVIYDFAVARWIPKEFGNEFLILFFFPAAYILSWIQKKSVSFFLCVFSLCFFVVTEQGDAAWFHRLWKASGLVAGVFLFELMITGLKDKLLFCPIPKPLQGLPILFVTVALLTLALWGLQGILI